ncbi:MAG: serine/threonine-protein kinase [Trueperaceae bacterium]
MANPQDGPVFVPKGYDIVQKLGSGQTSHVYLARHPVFGQVALKLPRPELSLRPVLKRMFENEASITVKLSSPYVVSAYDGYPTGEGAFLALEYCSGGTLDQHLLERGQLPLERACALIIDVAEGLTHTHERSVLHRDVKPANVFLTAEGRAKLGDFGTGMFQSEMNDERVGTAFYMAPEVFEGRHAGVRSDIYSLGILAYEVISGQRPFVADSYDALMVAHHTAVPKDLRLLRPEIGMGVVRVVSKAMMRDPQRRFESARAFVTAFRHATGIAPKSADAAADTADGARVTGRASRSAVVNPSKTGERAAGATAAYESAGGDDVRGGSAGDAGAGSGTESGAGRSGGRGEEGKDQRFGPRSGGAERPARKGKGLFGWLRRDKD